MRGRPVSGSMAMPSVVLIALMPVAPASTTARPTVVMSVTSGVSLPMIGRSGSCWRTAATTAAAGAGAQANTSPRCSTLGHERFTSTAAMPRPSSRTRRATSPNSSTVLPAIEMIGVAPRSSRKGRSLASHPSMPGFCRPIALSMPDGVSCMRGVGRPWRGSSVTDLTSTAPRSAMSKNRSISAPLAKQPDAVVMGLAKRVPPRVTDRSTSSWDGARSSPHEPAGRGRTSLMRGPPPRSGCGPSRSSAPRRPARRCRTACCARGRPCPGSA